MKKTTIAITVVVVLLVGWALYYSVINKPNIIIANSFEECVTAGYPVIESYPRQCRTSGGITFTEALKVEMKYVNATDDLIKVSSPRPGAKVTNNFGITGTARGTWYFEASFPVVVTDNNGIVLFQGPAQAQSDWMTPDFVPFKIDIKIPGSYTGPATVTLNKDNPSGLAEKDASVSLPINIGN